MPERRLQLWLAAGAVAFFLLLAVLLGPVAAGLLAASATGFLVVLNVVRGRNRDAADASQIVASALASSRRLKIATALVWFFVIAIALAAMAASILRKEFSVSVIDEYGLPVSDARLEVEVGARKWPAELRDGIARVNYSEFNVGSHATLIVNYRGKERRVVISRDSGGNFQNTTLRVFSGNTVVSVAHVTARGLAIEAFLNGRLPPELASRYADLSVLPNEVYSTARRFVNMYDVFDGSILEYERAESVSGNQQAVATAEASEGTRGDPALTAYLPDATNLRFPRTLYVDIGTDMSRDILGMPTGSPLPPGFRIQLMQPGDWLNGDEAIPDPTTAEWIGTALPQAARSESGSVRLRLEALLGANQLAGAMSRSRSFVPAMHEAEGARAYVDFMIRSRAPPGLIGATIHLDPRECGDGYAEPHIQLVLPEPELRVSILKNVSSYPLRIEEIVSSLRSGGELWRMDSTAEARREVRSEFDTLGPGEALLVPRFIGIRAVHTDEEVRILNTPDTGIVGQLRLIPQQDSYPQDYEAYSRRISLMPPALLIDHGRIAVAPSTSEPNGTSDILAVRHHRGPLYALGPVVDEIEYVVNGVRLQVRPDTGAVITMLGGWELGSCPFVFAHQRDGTTLNVGTIINDRIGRSAAGRDRIRLPNGVVRVELRELEEEVSYIDAATLIVVRNGNPTAYAARGQNVAVEDGRYTILRRGERLVLDFGYEVQQGDAVWLEISGYYEPAGA